MLHVAVQLYGGDILILTESMIFRTKKWLIQLDWLLSKKDPQREAKIERSKNRKNPWCIRGFMKSYETFMSFVD